MEFPIKSAVIGLVIVNIAAFMLQILLGDTFTSQFLLIQGDILERPWILVTYMFLHGSPMHLVFNMYVLFIFGPLLEQSIGTKRFLSIYFAAGILAAFVSSFFYASALGASGAVMGMLGVMIMLMPNLQLLFFFIIPMSLRTAAFFFVAIDVFGVFYPSGVGNIAHLVGLATGLYYGYKLKKVAKVYKKKFVKKQHLNKDDLDEYLKSGRI